LIYFIQFDGRIDLFYSIRPSNCFLLPDSTVELLHITRFNDQNALFRLSHCLLVVQVVNVGSNDVKKLRHTFDWKSDLKLEHIKTFITEDGAPKPPESNLNQRGTYIVHDVKEDPALLDLLEKVQVVVLLRKL
jgi:hypothetical protein